MAHHHTDEYADEEIIIDNFCEVCGDELDGIGDYRRHKVEHAANGDLPDETAEEDDGPDMIKFTSGFCLIVGGLLCMTLIGAPLGLIMVAIGGWLYMKYDVEFEVTK